MPHPTLHPRPPDLPTHLDACSLDGVIHDATHVEVELCDLTLADQHAKGVTFRATRLTRIDLSSSRLEHLRLVDDELEGCNLANVRGQHAELMRVSIKGSRLTGVGLSNATLQDVTISDARVDLASFSLARLTRVTFEDCQLSQSDFLDAQLECVRFHRCDLSGADFRGARLDRCEFRRCELTALEGVQSLRGSAMEWSDIVSMASVWAAALGIGVLDTD
jgi:uncharacterized protein YjbI with pentapeptide repeats